MELNISLGIPQVLMIGCYVFVLIMNIAKHGQVEERKYNQWTCLIGTALGLLLLNWGGFFS